MAFGLKGTLSFEAILQNNLIQTFAQNVANLQQYFKIFLSLKWSDYISIGVLSRNPHL